MRTLVGFDGNWYIHRAFHILRGSFKASQKIPHSFVSMVCKDAMEANATHLLIAFDGANGFRYQVYPRYKDRKSDETELSETGQPEPSPYEYLPETLELLTKLKLPWKQIEGYEADDVLVTMAALYERDFDRIRISSLDKDLMQCVTAKVSCWHPAQKKDDTPREYGLDGVMRKWKLTPSQLVDYQTLMGDAIDTIPAILGMTDKKARKLITQYGSLVNFFQTKEGKAYWKANREELLRNRALVKMSRECFKRGSGVEDLKLGKVNDADLKGIKVSQRYYELRSALHPRTKSLFG